MGMTRRRTSHIRQISSAALVWILSATLAAPVQAQVAITDVVHGDVVVHSPVTQVDGTVVTDIRQSTAMAIAHASSFSIAPNHIVNVIQPNAAAWMLVRVFGPASQIDGMLNANGSLVLLNPNGVFIGSTGQVSVGGMFAASTLGLSNSNFLNGLYLFQDSGTNGVIRNAGTINAGIEGVYLFAPNVENAATGIITSANGHVSLGAGTTAFLSDRPDGKGFLSEVTAPAGEALNLGQLFADGGQVTMAGRVVNQGNLVQANSVVQRNGRIELVASEQVTMRAGSRTVSAGSTDGSHGGTVIAMAATRDASGARTGGTVLVESGAEINVTPGSGGVAGEFWLGGSTVTPNETIHRLIPNQVTLGDSEFLSLASSVQRGEVNVLAMDDINVTASTSLDFLTLPSGRTGAFHLNAGRNVTWTNSRFVSEGLPWNIVAKAGNDLTINASDVSTAGGASIHLHAGRDLALVDGNLTFARVHTANIGSAVLGGNISLTALRDVVARSPFDRPSENSVLPGIHVGLPGNLTVRAGQDVRGPVPQSSVDKPVFGFTLQGGIADVSAGRDIAGESAPAKLVIGGFKDNGDGTFSVPAAAVNLNAGRSVYFSLAEDFGLGDPRGILTANGSTRIDARTVLNTRLQLRTEIDAQTGLPVQVLPTQLNLTARTGDVLILPPIRSQDRPKGAFADARGLLPSVFSAQADQGNVTFVTGGRPLRFWPSNQGSFRVQARQHISGLGPMETVPDQNSVLIFTGLATDPSARWVRVSRSEALANPFLATWLARWGDQSYVAGTPVSPPPTGFIGQPPANVREKPPISVRSTSPGILELYPGDVQALVGTEVFESDLARALTTPASNPALPGLNISMTTEQGDIFGFRWNFLSQAVKQVTISSGKDIKGIDASISTPPSANGEASVLIHAKGSIDLRKAPGFNTSGISFFGRGTAKLRANGNIDLGDSVGLIHRLGASRNELNQRKQGGLLDIGAGGSVEMTQSQIATFNGGSIFIHGADGVRLVDATGNPIPGAVETNAVLIDQSGKMILGLSTQNGAPVPIEAFKTMLAVDSATLSQARFSAQDVKNGQLELSWKPLYVEQTGQLLLVGGERVKQGDTVVFQQKIVSVDLSPARDASGKPILTDGKPALVDGLLMLNIGGQSVKVVSPVGGKVNVGGTAAGGNAEQAGIVTLRGGGITILSTGNVDVNRSRVGTFDTGDILIKSTSGTINAGSGSKDERASFIIDNGDGTNTIATVPGSGIFTWERDDPDFSTLPFPKFNTPQMDALFTRIAMHNFIGRDASNLVAEFDRLAELRTVEFDRIFEDFINAPFGPGSRPLQLGDISLIAARNIDVPEAGIRGRRINLEAGEELNLLGGSIIGKTTFTAASVSGSLGAFGGSAAGSVGGASVSAAGGAGGGSVGGLSGATATVSATSASTSSTSSSAAKAVEQVQQTASESTGSPSNAKQVASKDGGTDKKSQMTTSVQVKRGVVIQVDVKPQAGS